MDNKVLIFSAPSGAGKSTIVGHILGIWKDTMEFSVSATSRAPRGTEQNGKEYHFVTPEEFRKLIEEDRLVEYEEVYKDHFYGTLKSEVERIWAAGHTIIFDVDVKGGINLKKYFGDKALSIFIKAPSVEVLRQRLVKRGTDSPEAIAERVAKASREMEFAPQFDYVLVNDDLATAFGEVEKVVEDFLDDGKLNYSTFI
ncbi:MAG: guanylate kinase [Candidatus Cryptobacteroides sp.]